MGGRVRAALSACLLLLCCPSCFTVWVWGGELHSERGPDGDHDLSIQDGSNDLSGPTGFVARLLMTPVAIALDCVTFPVQAFLYGLDGDDDR